MKLFYLLAIACMWGVTIIISWTFLVAYSNPDKFVTIFINRFGEANVELVLLAVILVSGFITLFATVKGYLGR